MASYTLYPPIVDGAMPAFVTYPKDSGKESYCRVYFSLSKFNASIDFKYAHVSITKQTTGERVVNPVDGEIHYYDDNDVKRKANVYRSAGIILDMPVVKKSIDNNEYYIDIDTTNLNTKKDKYEGWVPGFTYKVQIRLSTVSYKDDNPNNYGQSTWMNAQASNFSEWSTICIVKPTCQPEIDYVNIYPKDDKNYIFGSAFTATYSNADSTETLYNYKIKLYEIKDEDILIEDSGWIIAEQHENNSVLRYNFHTEFDNNSNYRLVLEYNTLNNYNQIIETPVIGFINADAATGTVLTTLENDDDLSYENGKIIHKKSYLSKVSSIYDEEEEGRIAYLISTNGEGIIPDKADAQHSGIYYIRRSDSRTNFEVWTDIKVIKKIPINGEYVFNDEVYYDYTIEDGIYYKYGIQTSGIIHFDDEIGDIEVRGPLAVSKRMYIDNKMISQGITTPIPQYNPSSRDMNYTFLVGQNEQQLKLKFDNNLSSFKINVIDTLTPTIGGRYPKGRRVGDVYYKTMSIGGLISYQMDENYLFASKLNIYGGNRDIVKLYKEKENKYHEYNMMYEREFRNKVFEFLHNGKAKLFKSPTEGNILVRLSDINFTPNQSLDRLVYSFTATATEIGDAEMDNYLKYKITNLYEAGNTMPVEIQQPHTHTVID